MTAPINPPVLGGWEGLTGAEESTMKRTTPHVNSPENAQSFNAGDEVEQLESKRGRSVRA